MLKTVWLLQIDVEESSTDCHVFEAFDFDGEDHDCVAKRMPHKNIIKQFWKHFYI